MSSRTKNHCNAVISVLRVLRSRGRYWGSGSLSLLASVAWSFVPGIRRKRKTKRSGRCDPLQPAVILEARTCPRTLELLQLRSSSRGPAKPHFYTFDHLHPQQWRSNPTSPWNSTGVPAEAQGRETTRSRQCCSDNVEDGERDQGSWVHLDKCWPVGCKACGGGRRVKVFKLKRQSSKALTTTWH
jgi:hypothetical protein